MNCHNCKFRQTQSHTHHITCVVLDHEPQLKMKCMLLGQVSNKIGSYVTLNQHGVKNGWATWPLDFDQIWIEDCQFFQGK